MLNEFVVCYEILRAERKEVEEKITDLKVKALELHPLKVDDKVIVNGWSHTGKEMIVNNLGVKEEYDKFFWTARGLIIKKNGETGVQMGDWSKKIEVSK